MLSNSTREIANIFIIQQHQAPYNIHFVRSMKNLPGFCVEKTTLSLVYPLQHENGLVLEGTISKLG